MTADMQTVPGLDERELAAILAKDDPAWSGIVETPFLHAEKLSDIAGCELWVKFENLQYTGSFKERGALAKLLSLSAEERAVGVIAASAGNHAQGLARHAARLGVSATIVMPRHTPFVKVRQTEDLGACVVLEGDDFDAAYAFAREREASEGLVFVHPFDDPRVIAGQGTIAMEMLAVRPDLEAIIAPIGGGGLLAGLSVAARRVSETLEIVGAEAALYPSMRNALFDETSDVGGMTLAEGVAVREPGRLTRQILKRSVDDVLLADERELERALSLYLNVQKVLAEGAGAVGLAAILAHPDRFRGRRVGTVLCGGNIDTRLLSAILMRDLARQGRIARLRVELLDVPGQLTLVSAVISEAKGNVIDVAYHRLFSDLPAKITYLDISVETNDRDHLERVIEALRDRGLKTEIASY